MRGYVQFSFWIPIALRRSAHKNTFVLVGKFLKDLNISDQTSQVGQNVCAVKQKEVPSLKHVDLKRAFRLLVCFLNFFLCIFVLKYDVYTTAIHIVIHAIQRPLLFKTVKSDTFCFTWCVRSTFFHKKLILESKRRISCMQWIIHDF